jgi:hypothetical protein
MVCPSVELTRGRRDAWSRRHAREYRKHSRPNTQQQFSNGGQLGKYGAKMAVIEINADPYRKCLWYEGKIWTRTMDN